MKKDKATKGAKLKSALRDNLKKRKAQTRKLNADKLEEHQTTVQLREKAINPDNS